MAKTFFLAAALCAALPVGAGAATAFFSTGRFQSGQGQVSDYSGSGSGVIEERFRLDRSTSECVSTKTSFSLPSTVAPGFSAQLTNQAVRGQALPPGTNRASLTSGVPVANNSCYLAVPALFSFNTFETIDVAVNPRATNPTRYFGFYWGSIDPYNFVTLSSKTLDAGGDPIVLSVPGLTDADGTITGAAVLALLGAAPGYNAFIHFRFDAIENFGTVTLASNGRAFETDNFAYSLNDVAATTPPTIITPPGVLGTAPFAARRDRSARSADVREGARVGALAVGEPTAFAVLGAGLGLVAFARRRSR